MAPAWPGAPVANYRETRGLAIAAQALFAVIAGLLALTAIQGISLTDDLDSASMSELQDAAGAVDGTRAMSFVASFALMIVLAIWCSAMTKNLDGPLRSPGLRFRSGMAAGGWFIPLANLVIPGMVLTEVWKASSPSSPPGTDQWRQEKTSPLVVAWWIGFLGWALGWFAVVSNRPSEDGLYTLSDVKDLISVHNVWSSFGAIAAVIGLLAVRDIDRRHRERARALGVSSA